MARKTTKSRTVKARVIGAVPNPIGFWKVRLAAPYLPFYLDSALSFATKAEADKEAEKWRHRTVTITTTRNGK